MPRQRSPSKATSLYRLVRLTEAADAVQEKYDETRGFAHERVVVHDRDALLVSGAMSRDRAPWTEVLGGLVGRSVELGNLTAAAVLVIPADEGTGWALAYGMGFHLLDQNHVDPGFGQRIAIRIANPDQLSSLTRTTLDSRARVDRSSIPRGDNLRVYGAGDFGELVTRVVSKASVTGLTASEAVPTSAAQRAVTIRGADALNIPLARSPRDLLTDLDLLTEILQRPALPELEILEQLVKVKNDPDLEASLDDVLRDALTVVDLDKLGSAYPHERIDENGIPEAFQVARGGPSWRQPRPGLPRVEDLVDLARDGADPIHRLQNTTITLLNEPERGAEPVSPAIPSIKWLAFETTRGHRRYCLHDGSWYLMDTGYADKISHEVRQLFHAAPPIQLPAWPTAMTEEDYNRVATDVLPGAILLDRRLLRTTTHRHGIEACDILLPEGVALHVKRADRSSPLSHLMAQALVAEHAISFDEETRAALTQRIVESGHDPGDYLPRPTSPVVLVVARPDRPVTADSLFSFSQVALLRAARALAPRPVHVVNPPS